MHHNGVKRRACRFPVCGRDRNNLLTSEADGPVRPKKRDGGSDTWHLTDRRKIECDYASVRVR